MSRHPAGKSTPSSLYLWKRRRHVIGLLNDPRVVNPPIVHFKFEDASELVPNPVQLFLGLLDLVVGVFLLYCGPEEKHPGARGVDQLQGRPGGKTGEGLRRVGKLVIPDEGDFHTVNVIADRLLDCFTLVSFYVAGGGQLRRDSCTSWITYVWLLSLKTAIRFLWSEISILLRWVTGLLSGCLMGRSVHRRVPVALLSSLNHITHNSVSPAVLSTPVLA